MLKLMPVRKIPKLISKSKLMRGYQCQKQIYLTVHHPQFEAPITPDKQAIFDQGNEVGELARKYFPGGVLIDALPWDFVGSLRQTRELLEAETPAIYEAAFEYKGCYARLDIIKYQPESQRWKLYEVKSSTSVKDEQLQDIALQAWIIAKAGLPIEEINLVHLNRECTYPDLENLFTIVDVTDKVRKIYPSIEAEVSKTIQTIRADEVPDIKVGRQCFNPYECGFKEHCFNQADVPEVSVLNLPKLGEKKWELFDQGVYDLADVEKYLSSDDFETPEVVDRILTAHQSHENFINESAVKAELNKWEYPLRFLDFETIASAIPQYIGCRPYEQVPFQFSCHELVSEGAELQHKEFLWTQDSDPRPELIGALLEACGDSGSIVAYYAQFEIARIKELASTFLEYKDQLLALVERLVDPLPIIREHIYCTDFEGSFSLKKVAPALLGDDASYKGLVIADGVAAQIGYKRLLKESDFNKRNAIEEDLLRYCEKDTKVLVDLYKKLKDFKL